MRPFRLDEWEQPKYFSDKVTTSANKYGNPAEEPVRQWMLDCLIKEFKVPEDQIELEVVEKITDERASFKRRPTKRPDIEIFDDRFTAKIVFIMVECLAPEHREGSDVWNEHYDRLNQYMALSNSARYAILTNGIETRFYKRDLEYPRALEQIPIMPAYESAREAARNRKFTVVYDKRAPDSIKTGLRAFSNRDEFRRVLGDTRGGIHGILRSNEGRNPVEAVEDMTKIIFAKFFDEIETIRLVQRDQEDRAYVFSAGPNTDPERSLSQIRTTFENAKDWEKEILESCGRLDNSRRIFDPESKITLRSNTLYQIVDRIQPYSIHESPAALKGAVFEDFLGNTFRDDLGQFFTPTEVIDLIVRITDPDLQDVIGDPCCGPARFHTHSLVYIADKHGIDLENPQNDEFVKFRDNNLFGADYAEKILHIAKVNCLLNNAPFVDLRNIDSLDPIRSIVDYENGQVRGIGFVPDGCSIIMTNPPFGITIDDKQKLKEFTIVEDIRGKADSQILFIERCLQFLRNGGVLGIVLPESILDNKSNAGVRQWVYRNASILAIISLPLETFKPYGTGVKTAVLFLQKLTKEEKVSRSKQLKQLKDKKGLKKYFNTTSTSDEEKKGENGSKQVFMGYVNNIGYDNTGRLVEGSDLEDVIKAYQRFKRDGMIEASYGKHYSIDEERLNENRFDVKYHEPFPIDRTRFPRVCSLGNYCEVITQITNPSKTLAGQDIPYISIQELENDPFYVNTPEIVPADEIKSAKICTGGDVLLARLGPSLANKKGVLVNEAMGKCYISSEFLVLRPKKHVPPGFLLWLTKSEMLIKQGLAKSTGATPSRYRLHKEFIPEIILPEFSLEEQKKFGSEYLQGRRDIEEKIRQIKITIEKASPDF
ncbi:MAG: N-6 DNA methylase [Candidatus Odinarchaeota archaeon]